jgi:hypothetical protein
VTKELIEKYFIGSSKYRFHRKDFLNYVSEPGATVFWQIDQRGKIRAGKIMLYSPTTGKRIKCPYDHISWTHSALKLPNFQLQQCFFGEHLLKDNLKQIAICESEKTAIICSVYLPEFVCIAAGNKNGLNPEKCMALAGRNVVLFPDTNSFDEWKLKSSTLNHIANFTISNLLERKASESDKKEGLDLADYLIGFDYKKFQIQPDLTAKNDLLTIYSKDAVDALRQTILGKEFNNVVILFVETEMGNFDILYNDEAKLLEPGNEKLIDKIAMVFEKKFKPGLLDGEACFIHAYN